MPRPSRYLCRRLLGLLILAGIVSLASPAAGPRPSTAQAKDEAKTIPARGDNETSFQQQVQPVLQKYCSECHTGEKAKGDFRLDRLRPDLKTAETIAAWKAVGERLTSRSMPPKSKPQPTVDESKSVTQWLDAGLVSGELERRRREGRSGLRRLNRVEYENTIRDLLGIDLALKHTLPEDDLVDGFDNVGSALTLSAPLLERYLEAADLALDAAIVRGPRPRAAKVRMSQEDKTLVKNKDLWRNALEKEDAAILFSPTPVQASFRPTSTGRFRIRVAAHAYQNQGRSMILRVFTDGQSTSGGYQAIPADKSTVIDFVTTMGPRDSIRLAADGVDATYIREVANHRGPGVAIEWIEVEGPLFDDWPPPSHQRLLGTVDLQTGKADDAEKVLREFIPRAFRQPATEDQMRPFIELARTNMAKGAGFEAALRGALRAVLCSPRFLLLRENPGRLDDYSLASRLSYFLWRSMPDRELLDLAREKKLGNPAELTRQVERMLKDPRAAALTQNFLGQWLSLRQIDATAPDKVLYPEFDDFLRYSMLRETELFFEEILNNDLSLLNFVDSDFAMLNERLARHYGIPDIEGPDLRAVKLPRDSHRGGLLTQASILKLTANGTETSPVIRGVWVLTKLLGETLPPPPADAGAIEPDTTGTTTIRDQLAKHRKLESCSSCHEKIDPPGFALENYDVIGGWRDNVRVLGKGTKVDLKVKGNPVQYRLGPRVDAGDITPEGQRFKDIEEYKKLLLAKPETVARCVTEKLLVYATGAPIRPADRPAVTAIVTRVRARNYGLRALVHELVQSELFLHK